MALPPPVRRTTPTTVLAPASCGWAATDRLHGDCVPGQARGLARRDGASPRRDRSPTHRKRPAADHTPFARCFLAATGARKKPCRQSGTSTCRATFWPVFIDTKCANQSCCSSKSTRIGPTGGGSSGVRRRLDNTRPVMIRHRRTRAQDTERASGPSTTQIVSTLWPRGLPRQGPVTGSHSTVRPSTAGSVSYNPVANCA